MALKRVWIPSPNYSSRSGGGVRLIVLHTAEGATTIESLGGWFGQTSSQVSSHCGADDKVNTVGEYVKRDNKAWTQASYNSQAVAIEMCGFASWSQSEWLNNHANMLDNTAKWIAEEAAHYGIPIKRLSSYEAQGGGHGVCQHIDLGAGGGGHVDCGSGFPMDHVLDLARGGGGGTQPTETDEDMIASEVAANGTLHVFWVDKGGKNVCYRYQRKGENAWNDGGVLATAPKQVAGLSATKSATGTLELFARYDDGNVAHTWQNQGETSWHGGVAGECKAAFTALPGGD